jgi:hypothetical protein
VWHALIVSRRVRSQATSRVVQWRDSRDGTTKS